MNEFSDMPDLAFPTSFDADSILPPSEGEALGPIDNFIPHRAAMRFIDRLIEADDAHAVAEADIVWNGPFVREGGVPAWFGIEYMAQTVAAWAGYRARATGGESKIGLLLGSRHFEVRCKHFPVGSTLRVEARSILAGTSGLGLFDCHLFVSDVLLAIGRLSVFEPTDGDFAARLLAS